MHWPKRLIVVTPARFERATFPLGGGRSIQLSYGAWKRCEGYSVIGYAAIPLGHRTRRGAASPLSFRAHTRPQHLSVHGSLLLESPLPAWRQPIAPSGCGHVDAAWLPGWQDTLSTMVMGAWRCRCGCADEQAGLPGAGNRLDVTTVHRLQRTCRIFRRRVARSVRHRNPSATVLGCCIRPDPCRAHSSIPAATAYPLLDRSHRRLAVGRAGRGLGSPRRCSCRFSPTVLDPCRTGRWQRLPDPSLDCAPTHLITACHRASAPLNHPSPGHTAT